MKTIAETIEIKRANHGRETKRHRNTRTGQVEFIRYRFSSMDDARAFAADLGRQATEPDCLTTVTVFFV